MSEEAESFTAVHDQFLVKVENAYRTGETDGLLPMLSKTYHGYFGTRHDERASYFGFDDAVEGIVQTAQAYPGVRSAFHHRHIRMPSESDAVVMYEKSMDFGAKIGYAIVLEVWRKVDGTWLLQRECTETA